MFERLTMWTRYGYQIKGLSPIAHDFDLYECKVLGDATARLAAYEDSGLLPEEVQELAKAEAEGRLVVLPCKVGDRVYSIYGYLNKSIQENTVKHICVQDGEIRLTMDNTCTKIWERSAFATREEAEKAIGGGQ